MKNERLFRTVRLPGQIFASCVRCLEMMEITLTKKDVLKKEGDDFDGIIEGTRTYSAGRLIIRLTLHGYRDYKHHAGFWPSAETTVLTIETFEVSKDDDEELPDTPNAKALNEEFNNRFNLYVWGSSG